MKSEGKAGNEYFSVSYVFIWTRLIWYYILCNMFQWVSSFTLLLSVLGVCIINFRFLSEILEFLCNLVGSLLSVVCVLSVVFSLPVMFFLLLMYHHIGKLCLSIHKNCLISWDTGVHLEADQSFPTRWWTSVTRSPEQPVYVWIQKCGNYRELVKPFLYERATLPYVLLPRTKFETMSLRENKW